VLEQDTLGASAEIYAKSGRPIPPRGGPRRRHESAVSLSLAARWSNRDPCGRVIRHVFCTAGLLIHEYQAAHRPGKVLRTWRDRAGRVVPPLR
jgi:hypothetical protein